MVNELQKLLYLLHFASLRYLAFIHSYLSYSLTQCLGILGIFGIEIKKVNLNFKGINQRAKVCILYIMAANVVTTTTLNLPAGARRMRFINIALKYQGHC